MRQSQELDQSLDGHLRVPGAALRLQLAQQDAEAQLASLRKTYASTFRAEVKATDWRDKESIESHAEKAARELCQTLTQRADVIWAALARGVGALPDGEPIAQRELTDHFDRVFKGEVIRALEVSSTLLEEVPGRDFEQEVRATTIGIRKRIEVEAGYAAAASAKPASRSRSERFLHGVQEHKVVGGVVIVGIVVISVAAFIDAFEHIGSAGTELLAKRQPQTPPPVSMESFPVAPGRRFESVANDIARLEGRSIDLSSCPPKLAKSAVASGTVHAADAAGLIEELRGLLGHGAPLYVVRLDRDREVYEVRCDK